ncbi:MAG: FkbM family methyltransferase [Candidatus Cloacimonetes bacterium]|nr:FkbM family methyltransferase [Candidatus Cloacimonadota bacterium]
MTLLERLGKIKIIEILFHFFFHRLKLRFFVDGFLHLFPLKKRIPESGTFYRCRYLETIFVADEFFNRKLYHNGVPENTTTFVDLGCNIGLFIALIVHITKQRDLRGLAIDANQDMINETNWIIKKNGLKEVYTIHGLVGSQDSNDSEEFYINPSNLASSKYPIYEPGVPEVKGWKKTIVPKINLEAQWKKHFGNMPCDLLKIDIEGSEKDFLVPINPFVQRVEAILIEWHTWIISFKQVKDILYEYGFVLENILEDRGVRGVAFFTRMQRNN